MRLPLADVRVSAPHRGFISVTREPGGRLGEWARTALLFRSATRDDVLLQLHRLQLQHWDSRGLVIAGIERHWRRKECTEFWQSWFVVFPEQSAARSAPRAYAAASPLADTLNAGLATAMNSPAGSTAIGPEVHQSGGLVDAPVGAGPVGLQPA